MLELCCFNVTKKVASRVCHFNINRDLFLLFRNSSNSLHNKEREIIQFQISMIGK